MSDDVQARIDDPGRALAVLRAIDKHLVHRLGLLSAMEPLTDRAATVKFHRTNELNQLVDVIKEAMK